MSRTVYVNGQFVPEEEAMVSVFDRAFLFADGVYEVSSVLNGQLIDNEAHLKRLSRSLTELRMPPPCDNETIEALQKELIARNNLTEGVVYLQVTRGSADRDFNFPADATPTLVTFTQTKNIVFDEVYGIGLLLDVFEPTGESTSLQSLFPTRGPQGEWRSSELFRGLGECIPLELEPRRKSRGVRL